MADLALFARRLAEALEGGEVLDKAELQHLKQDLARAQGVAVPADMEVIPLMPAATQERFRSVLRTKPMRSLSGVAIVAVMTSPEGCPHGKCIFCPGGPEVDAPQSYTGFEPSTLRAKRHAYESYGIVRGRLDQLARNGHTVEKVEIVIQGGTFPARDPAYQEWVVAGIYAGCNDGPGSGPFISEPDWRALPASEREDRLQRYMAANEDARCRIVGLTIETKPDWCFEEHLDAMLRFGATRIEVGLQCLDDAVLKFTNRGHTLDDSRRALQLARDSGFKVCAHLMPGLPRPRLVTVDAATSGAQIPGAATAHAVVTPATPGSRSAPTPQTSLPVLSPSSVSSPGRTLEPDAEADVEDFRRLFAEPDWRPDMLKIYPTLVVMEGETGLKRMWERGEYHPFDTATATQVIARAKGFVPEYCRIQRVDRDIPTTHVEAGVMNSNLRQITQEEMGRQGLRPCRCIRCREAGRRATQGVDVSPARVVPVRREYEASGGTEVFLSMEDPVADAVVAFLRLRKVGASHRPECAVEGGAAFVRELKVYGVAQGLAQHDDPEAGAWQHQGFGAGLLAEAERIAFHEWGVGRLLVIAGVGVKPYYRRHGYADCGPYVAKDKDRAGPLR